MIVLKRKMKLAIEKKTNIVMWMGNKYKASEEKPGWLRKDAEE